MTDCIITRYGEIGLKSSWVRQRFEQLLANNIAEALTKQNIDIEKIQTKSARNYIFCSDYKKALKVLKNVFGIVSYSPAHIVKSDFESIKEKALEIYKDAAKNKKKKFRVTSRRTKDFPIPSMELSAKVGEYILEKTNSNVDLNNYSININIEIKGPKAYIFTEYCKGYAGLPIGSTGKVVSLFSGLNSYLASWLMARRGCKLHLVYFGKKNKKVSDLYKELKKVYYCNEDLELEYLDGKLSLEKTAEIAENVNAGAIVTGSKKLSEISKSTLPVLTPVLALNRKTLKQITDI
ncbi:MAG TPA: hypothetical protein ENN30_01575 [Candidatus Woesearchaeota archaeon]|nr:hypothetical protein [Candidatus Woesearchaeota archaeon]